ncbi:hypothetical protein ABIC28_004345 [Rhodococcus sp. PvR044]
MGSLATATGAEYRGRTWAFNATLSAEDIRELLG